MIIYKYHLLSLLCIDYNIPAQKSNVFLKNKTIVIIHGHGLGIVKHAVYEALKYNKNVLSFKSDMFNDGLTVVTLKTE